MSGKLKVNLLKKNEKKKHLSLDLAVKQWITSCYKYIWLTVT